MDKPITFNEWLGTQGNMVLLHANCCRIAYEAGQQSQQAKVEELEQESQRLANGNTSYYNQAIKQNEIIDGLQTKLKQAYEDVDTFATAHEALEQRIDRDRSLIQFTQQANKDLIAERDELQKRVDSLEKILKEANEVVELNIETVERIRDKAKDIQERNYKVSMLYLLKPIRRVLEQALKGEG